ncbi:WD40 domain containing protein [Pyrrhoderma noxium]|uniref:WD40 domain containing protein n=1 Tax=Pyrrhoderma noxium TaxID=2282107 RepID=A0A286UDP4_9AGAM|nr:WD40 domain containing protein [Pyrrhoderma noxium]
MSNQPIPEGVTTFDPKLMYNDPEGLTFEIMAMDRDDDVPWWTEPEDNVSQKGESAAASVQKKGRKQKKEDGKNNEQKQKNRPESAGQRQSTRKRRASAPTLASPSTSKAPATTANRRSARIQSTSSASQSTSRPRANSTLKDMVQTSSQKSNNSSRKDLSVILVTGSYDHEIRFWKAWSGICSRTIARSSEQGSSEQAGNFLG